MKQEEIWGEEEEEWDKNLFFFDPNIWSLSPVLFTGITSEVGRVGDDHRTETIKQ